MTVEVLCGDCREVIPKQGLFDLIFCDPPFNIGQAYQGYYDKREPTEFEAFTSEWIAACWAALKPNGVLILHGPDDLADMYLFNARLLKMKRRTWINWRYGFGQCSRSNWVDARCHAIVYVKGPDFTWNPDDVLIVSDRVKYGDKRVNETERGGKRLPGTVWGIPSDGVEWMLPAEWQGLYDVIPGDGKNWGRVVGNSAERVPDRPNQLPEVYLERLIRAYTNPGDRILDPFCGTGTTAVVADALGRDCVTIDVTAEAVFAACERLKRGAVRIKTNG